VTLDPLEELRPIVETYHRSGDVGLLFDQLKAFAKRTPPEDLKAASQSFRDMPEVIIPIYERIVAALPNDAQSMVILANAYWLTGRGPNAVEQLAVRAKQADPQNRGAWHLWALTQPDIRRRVERWAEVSKRFPADQLARAALADNAVSLATEQDDPVALKLAIATYEGLLADSTNTAQRIAIEQSLKTLGAR
jgi:hypothetical protein